MDFRRELGLAVYIEKIRFMVKRIGIILFVRASANASGVYLKKHFWSLFKETGFLLLSGAINVIIISLLMLAVIIRVL